MNKLLFLHILFVGVSCHRPKDWFHAHLKTRTSWTASPCDNFYRFVCPKTSNPPPEDSHSIYQRNLNSDEVYAYSEYLKSGDLYQWTYTQCHNKTTDYCVFTKTQAALNAVDLNETVSFDNYYRLNRKYKLDFAKLDESLLNIAAMAAYAMWHEKTFEHVNFTLGEAVQEANWMMRPFLPKMEEMLIYTSYSDKNEKERAHSKYRFELQWKMNTTIRAPMISESAMMKFASEFTAIVKLTKRSLRKAGMVLGNSSMPIVLAIMANQEALNTSLHRNFPDFNQSTRDYLMDGTSVNAWNDGENLAIGVDGGLLMKAMKLRQPALRLATLGAVYGHELFHTHFRGKHSPKEQKRIDCIPKVAINACKKFGEEMCHSGPQTITEDGPDIEGLRLAYSVYKDKYASLLNAKIGGPHSAVNVRMNIALGQMPEFKEAFNCSEADIMIEEQQCNVFGDRMR